MAKIKFRIDSLGDDRGEWNECSKDNPCRICGKERYCAASTDGQAICRFKNNGSGEKRTDRNGDEFFFHSPDGNGAAVGLASGGRKKSSSTRRKAKVTKATPEVLDEVYRSFLASMPLSYKHKQALIGRGLDDNEITRRDYRSMGPHRIKAARQLVEAGLLEKMKATPGFYFDQERERWSIKGGGGLLVPVRDSGGRIVALKVRLDKPTREGKYRFVSSASDGGVGPGSPVHFPSFDGDTDTIRITEGELKADVVTHLTGILTLSMPGVASWKRTVESALAMEPKRVLVAIDSDAATNPKVAAALKNTVAALQDGGVAVAVEMWSASDAKGLDDLLVLGKKPDVVEGDRMWGAIDMAAKMAGSDDEDSGEGPDDPHRLARVILECEDIRHPQGPRLRKWNDEWFLWDGTRYVPRLDSEVRGIVTNAVKAEFDRLARQEARESKSGQPVQSRKVTLGVVANVANALSGRVGVRSDLQWHRWLDAANGDAAFLATESGIVDLVAVLRGGMDVVVPHSPLWWSPTCVPYDYDPTADCALWAEFLQRNLEGDDQRITLLQQFFGYSLTRTAGQQKFLILVGDGANGKSVICAAMTAMIGRDNVSHVPLELFGQRFALTATLGKSLNICAEVSDLDKFAEGYLKQFTAGDEMSFDRKHKSVIESPPTAKLVLATNNLPRFKDRSEGMWRRVLLLPMNVAIPTNERVIGMDTVTWWNESGELPGILNWAIGGLKSLRDAGRFIEPEVCRVALDDYRTENNPPREFLLEHCLPAPTGEVSKNAIYNAYKRFCDHRGYRPLGEGHFAKEVYRVFPGITTGRTRTDKGQRTYIYFGLTYEGEY